MQRNTISFTYKIDDYFLLLFLLLLKYCVYLLFTNSLFDSTNLHNSTTLNSTGSSRAFFLFKYLN